MGCLRQRNGKFLTGVENVVWDAFFSTFLNPGWRGHSGECSLGRIFLQLSSTLGDAENVVWDAFSSTFLNPGSHLKDKSLSLTSVLSGKSLTSVLSGKSLTSVLSGKSRGLTSVLSGKSLGRVFFNSGWLGKCGVLSLL